MPPVGLASGGDVWGKKGPERRVRWLPSLQHTGEVGGRAATDPKTQCRRVLDVASGCCTPVAQLFGAKVEGDGLCFSGGKGKARERREFRRGGWMFRVVGGYIAE